MNNETPIEWSALLVDAVSKPGIISDAYSRFWNYSTGNQILAMFQCVDRGIAPGPIHTFNGWKELGRHVVKGSKAIELCMPITCKSKDRKDENGQPETFAKFIFRKNWFVLSQTDGAKYVPQSLPEWTEDRALAGLNICRVGFASTDGNCQGYAMGRMVAVSPIAELPHKTLFHELAHVVLGHTSEGQLNDSPRTPRTIREVEAECVALIVCESLDMPGAHHSRGYIQHWLRGQSICDVSARKIFKAADSILKSGRQATENASC